LHSGDKFIEIIGLDPDMMHRASSLRLRRLLVDMNERVPEPKPYCSHTRGVFIPDQPGAKHLPEKVDGDREIGREDVYVVKTCAHDGPLRQSMI